jgi:hypothetical protein
MSKAMAKAAAKKQSWREYGFQHGWTRCNCGCKAPPGYRSATKSAPLWFRVVLFFEDTLHKFNDHCDVAAEDVKILKNGQVMSATAA